MKAWVQGEEIVGNSQQVTLLQLVKYAGASGDYNPLHFDFEYAKSKGQNKVLMHGMLGAGILSTLTTNIAGENGFVQNFEARFVKELQVDSVVTPTATILDISENRLNLTLALKNEAGETATQGKAVIILND